MLKTFEKYLESECHCSKEKNFLLAVSGGIDSTVVANLFFQSGISFAVAHCNFQLRGEESDTDEDFVKLMAEKMKVTFHVKNFDTKKFASAKGISIQMAARELRYAWFEELASEGHYDYIVIAHNRNDVVETVLLNLSRGTGIKGLTGIKPRQDRIVRPLLFASREEIEEYANTNGITWRDDSSNSKTKYVRNRIRQNIITQFETINPAFSQSVINMVDHLQQSEELLKYTIQNIRKEIVITMKDRMIIDIDKLLLYPATETILFELLRDFDCNSSTVNSILTGLNGIPGKQYVTSTHTITHDRSQLIITPNANPVDDVAYIDEETAIVTYPIHLTFKSFPREENYPLPVDRHIAALDREKLTFPLTLRRWKPGDAFHPLGMRGSQKLSDFLINNKISLPDKKNIWVIESAGDIAWIAGQRIDDRFKIIDQTEIVQLIEYKKYTEE